MATRKHFFDHVRDTNGTAISSATINVYNKGTTTDATNVYDAITGGSDTNPITTDTNGFFEFWLDPDDHNATQTFDIKVSHSSLTTKTFSDVDVLKLINTISPELFSGAHSVIASQGAVDTPAELARGASTILARLASGNIVASTPAQLRTLVNVGYIPLDITSAREIASNDIQNLSAHGGILCIDSTPKLKRVNAATDKALRLEWAASDVTEIQFPPVVMPRDLNPAVDITFHLLGNMSGSTDTPTIDVQFYDKVGDTEMGGVSSAFGSSLAEETGTIANANISGAPLGFFNITMIPGAHGTDTLYVYAAWIEYSSI